jgi:hypothetical protein
MWIFVKYSHTYQSINSSEKLIIDQLEALTNHPNEDISLVADTVFRTYLI